MLTQPDLASYPSFTAVFVVPSEVHLLDISGPIQVFFEASDYGAPITLRHVSMQPDESLVRSSSGLYFAQLEGFEHLELEANDIIFIPGFEAHILLAPSFFKTYRPFLEWLTRQYERGATICSICTGAFVLAEAGLLRGKICTTHWKYLEDMGSRYPNAKVVRNRLFVESDRLYSSAGVSSGIDLALYILEQRFNSQFSIDIAREIVIYFRRGELDPQLSIFLQYRNHMEDRIHYIQDWMGKHLDKKITLESLSELVNTSARNLSRLFKRSTGITIGQYHEKLRVERAVQLLSEQTKVEAVTQAIGLRSPNQLRHLLKRHRGVLPSDFQKMSE